MSRPSPAAQARQARHAAILHLLHEGHSHSDIAETVGCSRALVTKVRAEHDLPVRAQDAQGLVAGDVDWSTYSDLGRVGDAALELAERIRDEDPRDLLRETAYFVHGNPGRAAQIVLTLAALVDPAEGIERLNRRLAAVTANQVEVVRLGRRPWPGRVAS